VSDPKGFVPVKLVCGIMSNLREGFDYSEVKLADAFGPIDLRSPRRAFDLTDYYKKEMGPGLERMFVSFKRLVPPEGLSEAKLLTNSLEEEVCEHFRAARRAVNLDPGYLTAASLIMATTKDFSHRIPLQRGIYAHLEFLFQKNSIRPLDWTYPDLRGDRYEAFFLEARKAYMDELAAGRRSGGG